MANLLFMGDLHAGHQNVTKFRTDFRDEQDWFESMEIQYHKQVTKRDKVIFTGDCAFTLERLKQISKWVGTKELVCGNHDTDSMTMKQLVEHFDSVYALKKHKEFWLSHAPIHPAELRGKVNIHGHVHFATVNDIRYVNTSLENTDMKLISLHEIRTIIEQRKKFYSITDIDDGFVRPIPVGLK